MAAFICPTCKSDTNKLIAPGKDDREFGCETKLQCPNCYKQDRIYKAGLHDTFPGGVRGLTNGKAWEIKNRVKSPDDNKVYINKITGRETQY